MFKYFLSSSIFVLSYLRQVLITKNIINIVLNINDTKNNINPLGENKMLKNAENESIISESIFTGIKLSGYITPT